MITDNMVLQQNGKARIYGTADPNKTVTVTPSWSNTPYQTKSDSKGRWRISIDTPTGGYTPYSITISDGTPVTLSNVLIGEVWLASGQSNMEMPLKGFAGCCTDGGYDEVASARERADKIRFYTVPLKQSYEPLETIDATWTVPGPDTASEYSALGWHFAKRLNDVLDVPIGIVRCAYGGAKVESWTPREILETYSDVSLDPADHEKMAHYHRPLLMYNAMFNPAKDYTYKGIIWYQGCSNVGAHSDYPIRLANMVQHWRKELGEGDIPFYTVEIAPYEYGSEDGRQWAPLLREAQWKATEIIPNSGIICTNDLVKPYERYNIHPSDKATPGKRLAELALNKTYDNHVFPIECPRYKGHRIEDGAVRIAIESKSDGICRNYAIEGFEVAGQDRVFHPADSVWLDSRTNEFIVSSKDVPKPIA
ncbi:MAG: sialate O-acetylesterase, partial [Muribaculaceae bacterium]|nr:sialate O-acetylesterase [Muribaculaceae bacterium]